MIRNSRGNMPFALVAVTILLIASSYSMVSASVRDTEDAADNLTHEVTLLDSCVGMIEAYIERGLGELVYQVSTDSRLGTLENRIQMFQERADHWFSTEFPRYEYGITVHITGHSLNVRTEKMTFGDAAGIAEGYVPSFMKVEGKVSASFQSETGKNSKILLVDTDGSCALPLCAEMGSLFENSISGDGSTLSQMVSYQLTSLAQYRVINGYGALSQYGQKGADSIITDADVKMAYRNALDALECMYFRDSSGKEFFGKTDLAKELAGSDRRLTIDLNKVYAQALAARADDISGKWFDYFLGNVAISYMDKASDTLRNAWDSLTSFITSQNSFSAAPYVLEIAGNTDMRVRTGESFDFLMLDPSTGSTKKYTVGYPAVDLLNSGAVTNFKNDYRNDNNILMGWIRNVVNTAISIIAEGKGLGTISVSTDNEMNFAETISKCICQALENGTYGFDTVVKEVIDSDSIPDQFYSAIFDAIERSKDDIFAYSEEAFLGHIIGQISQSVMEDLSRDGTEHDMEEVYGMIRQSFLLGANRDVAGDYQKDVDRLMGQLGGLREVRGSGNTVITKICTLYLEGQFLKVDYFTDVERIAKAMCSEYSTNIAMNPYDGFTDISEETEFVLYSDGKVFMEKTRVSDRSNPSVHVGRASDRSSHETGFKESKDAAFCTVFPVTVRDVLQYEVASSGTLLYALGLCDSSFRGEISVDLCLEIPVVSGWGLAGVEYSSSTDILKDLYAVLMAILEPLLEPLRKIMEMAQDAMDILSKAVMTAAEFATEYLQMLYNALFAPLELMSDVLDDVITEFFCEQVIKIAEGAEALVDVSAVGQMVGFTYMGFTLKFTFNIATLEKYTKNIVKAEFEGNIGGNDISAFINVKTKGETKKTPFITGGFSITGKDWNLSAKIDPKMTSNKCLMSLSGAVKGIHVDAVLPEAVQYNQVGIALSDMPGIGAILDNIPSPIAGTKISLDAGVNLKYSIPLETGILINEFESNPEGTDTGKEWAEILNLSGRTVDLNNWTMVTSKGKVHVIKDVQLNVGERTVVEFPGTFLVNTKEFIILKDPDGNEVSRSATMSDDANDSRTCQRGMDGSTEWSLSKGTPGTTNTGGILGEDGIAANIVKDIVKKAAVKAMNEMKHVHSTEELQELLTRTVKYAVDDGINRIANCLVEGSIYVTVDFTDVTGSGRTGFSIYIMVDKDIVGDILKYLLGKAEALFMNISDPYNINIDSVLYDDVYFGVSVYGGIKPPKILSASKRNDDDKVTLGIDIRCNLSALGGLFGKNLGTPAVKAQIGIKNCPYELIPKSLGVKKNMTYDLWFVRMTFTPAS